MMTRSRKLRAGVAVSSRAGRMLISQLDSFERSTQWMLLRFAFTPWHQHKCIARLILRGSIAPFASRASWSSFANRIPWKGRHP